MSHKQLAELHAHGWDIGAHTLTHPYLTRLSPEDATREIAQCKGVIVPAQKALLGFLWSEPEVHGCRVVGR